MLALLFAIAALVGSIALTVIVYFANMMSSSPNTPFQGGFLVSAAWAATLLLWLVWILD
jgi:hypothetical protein